ncbi:DUF4440 domain-containing protein [Maritimibacter sp. 55A14]|uniref:YybH family protein n=1 Tax=Maritimibacter sp. 55A14 TaxID=2174844 RepID=UPI001304CA9A|nr:DUF4440 domain-containing protein [Maritimibacter sp. 55A14]
MIFPLRSCAVVAFSAIATFAQAGAPDDIAARNSQFETAFNSGNASGVAALYTPDAVVMPPSAAPIEGREGISALWQSFIDAGAADLHLVRSDLEVLGDTANEAGTLSLTVPDGNGGRATFNGKYIVIWKRLDDVWHLDRDIWNETPSE